MKITQFFLLITSLLSFVVSAHPNVKSFKQIETFAEHGIYNFYEFDVNNDKHSDVILSSALDSGSNLYVYLWVARDKYKLIYKGTNFSDDILAVSNIKKLKNGTFEIALHQENQGKLFAYILLEYKHSKLYLNGVEYKIYSTYDQDSREDVCTFKVNKVLTKQTRIPRYPRESERPDVCRLNFDIAENLKDYARYVDSSNGEYIGTIQRYQSLLLKYPINAKNVYLYNNIAVALSKKYLNDEAIFLLKKVITVAPKRAVAHLNLGDIYWGKFQYNEAMTQYRQYGRLMKVQHQGNKVPRRIAKLLVPHG